MNIITKTEQYSTKELTLTNDTMRCSQVDNYVIVKQCSTF